MYSAHPECPRTGRLSPCILAGFDLHPWHPQREQFGAGDENHGIPGTHTMIPQGAA